MLFTAILTGDTDNTASTSTDLNAIRERYSTGGTPVYALGEPTSTDDFKKISEEDFKKGDTIGIIVAIDRPADRVRLAPGRRHAHHHGDLRDLHRARVWWV